MELFLQAFDIFLGYELQAGKVFDFLDKGFEYIYIPNEVRFMTLFDTFTQLPVQVDNTVLNLHAFQCIGGFYLPVLVEPSA